MGLIAAVDQRNITQAGWGIILAQDSDPAVAEALAPLINLRHEQAGDLFRLYDGEDGYHPGESKTEFLARHGAGPGPADPGKVPYYLLIAGSPESIPYRFQSQLDIQYAVGRIFFDTPEEYARYARNVVAAESSSLSPNRQAAFFSPTNPGDQASWRITKLLVEPLVGALTSRSQGWKVDAYLGDGATKEQLNRLLGKTGRPAFLFATGHGLTFPPGSPRQLDNQGALLCQDWPGPEKWREAIPQDFYFTADDLSAGADLSGMVAMFYASYSAGTPRLDELANQAFKEQLEITPHAFVAALPAKMLSHPQGGALAVIGLVDRAWGFSLDWAGISAETKVYENVVRRLLDGYPVGSAVESFNFQYAELATQLTDELEEIEFGKQSNPVQLAGTWLANNDARSIAIVGDPAVRLPVATR